MKNITPNTSKLIFWWCIIWYNDVKYFRLECSQEKLYIKVAMIVELLEGLQLTKLLLNGTLFHMRCDAHRSNLIVKQDLLW